MLLAYAHELTKWPTAALLNILSRVVSRILTAGDGDLTPSLASERAYDQQLNLVASALFKSSQELLHANCQLARSLDEL